MPCLVLFTFCRCECQAINAAGRLLADLASSLNGILGTGRVCGDNGQASYVGRPPGQELASRPDHILMSSAFFRLADNVQILPVKHISDHCTMSLHFLVEEAGLLADWSLNAGHRCAPRGCGECFALRWRPDRYATYVAALEANSALQGQFKQAIAEKDLEKACCLLRSFFVHAAGEPGVDIIRSQSLCAHLKRSRGAARDPTWFSEECAMLRRQGGSA